MIRIEKYSEFSAAEREVLNIIDQMLEVNEGVIGDALSKLGDWFERLNDGIRNLMLAMMEKGLKAVETIKKFFRVVLDKVAAFREKHPIIFRTVVITLVLLVLFFVLCSAAASPDKKPADGVINAAIGFLNEIQHKGSDIDDGVLMKAQAYLFELKKSGTEIKVGDEAVKAANNAINIIQQNVQEYKKSGGTDETTARYLMNLAERGAQLVSYKIKEYSDATGDFKSQDISLSFK